MLQKIIKQKERVKPDKDRIGVTYSCKWDTATLDKEGKYIGTNGKRYVEVDVDTYKKIDVNDRSKY